MSLHKRLFPFLPALTLAFLIAACKSPPPPPPVSAVCNPVPITPEPLPNFVESITYQGPEIYGPVYSLYAEGETVYLGLGNAFAILDASNAAEPTLIGALLLNALAFSGLNIYSIRDDLVFLGSGIRSADLSPEYIVNISNRTSPVQVNCDPAVPLPNENSFNDHYYIYEQSGGGIAIHQQSFDGSNSQEIATYANYTSPQLGWSHPPGQLIPLPYIIRPIPYMVNHYATDERYLYIVDKHSPHCCGQLTILDLSDPANPDHINTTSLPEHNEPTFVDVKEDFLFITFFAGFYLDYSGIYHIENHKEPVELTTVPDAEFLQYHNGYAYFNNSTDRVIEIWNLTNKSNPRFVSTIAYPERLSSVLRSSLTFIGDYIYLANRDTLELINNVDPENPYFMAQMQFPLLVLPNQLAINGTRLIAKTNGNNGADIQALEIDGSGQLGEWKPFPGLPEIETDYAMAVAENHLYALNHSIDGESTVTNLKIFDLGIMTGPNLVGSLSIQDVPGSKIAATASNLFILTFGTIPTLQIVDISDKSNPILAAEKTLETADYSDIIIWEDNLYLAANPDQNQTGIWHYDISDPLNPTFIAFYESNPFTSITAGDGFLFGIENHVYGYSYEIEVFDLRPLTAPSSIDNIQLPQGSPIDIVYDNGILYVSLTQRGLAAIELNLK